MGNQTEMDNNEKNKDIKADILQTIEETGIFIAYIESDGYCPSFGYSIGLFKGFNHPELIVIGFNFESTGSIINNAKEEIEKGTKFLEGINYPDFLIDFPVQFIEVEKEHYQDYLGFAGWYNDDSFDFPAFQIVWTDKDGHFPWEDVFNENLKFKQPILDRNTEFKFLEERNLGVFTTHDVLKGAPILYVYHNEDGDWQFHSSDEPDLNDAKLVCLEQLVKMDDSLNTIYYLNYGESASRLSIEDDWQIYESE